MPNCVERKWGWKKWWTWAALGAVAVMAGFIALSVFRIPAAIILIAGVFLVCPLLHLVGGHNHGPANTDKDSRDRTITVEKN